VGMLQINPSTTLRDHQARWLSVVEATLNHFF
jgi:hypothetical protein